MVSIVTDDEVFAQFKEDSRKQYKRMWLQFGDYLPQCDFESGPPGEDSLVNFFKYLRLEKKFASTTLWTWYSCVNSMMKRKYNVKLQNLPCLTMLLKGFDTDVKEKAHIFDEDEIKTFMLADMESAYWLVRQAITIVAFFDGLRLQECQDLKLEKIVRTQDGFRIVHTRVKQRSDQRDTAFIVPAEGGFADRLAVYLEKIHTRLNYYSRRVWWTGTKGSSFKNLPMGRHDRQGAPRPRHPVEQGESGAVHLPLLQKNLRHFCRQRKYDFWSDAVFLRLETSVHVPGIYLYQQACTVKHGQTLANTKFDLSEPTVEVEVVVPDKGNVEEVPEAKKENKVELVVSEDTDPFLLNLEMDEDPEMYQAAGILLAGYSSVTNSMNIEQTIQSVMSSVPNLQGANVSLKVCVITNNHGSVNF